MSGAQQKLELELRRRQLLLESQRNRVILALEAEKLRPAAAVADRGIAIARLAGDTWRAFGDSEPKEGSFSKCFTRILSAARLALAVWKLYRSRG